MYDDGRCNWRLVVAHAVSVCKQQDRLVWLGNATLRTAILASYKMVISLAEFSTITMSRLREQLRNV
jgi:hypothetical protein